MKKLQIILISLATLVGCNNNSNTNAAAANTHKITKMHKSDTLDYLALGDSYTIGESIQPADSYPFQLAVRLKADKLKINPPTVIATTGWTTDDLIGAIAKSDINDQKFDFVTLLIGVNDQYQQLSIDNYKTNFAQLLKTAINFANGNPKRVFVISIPDWGATPFGRPQAAATQQQIDGFNAVNKAISDGSGVNYLNVTDLSRTVSMDPSLVAADGLHYSARMYKAWVNLLEPQVVAQLKK